MPVDSSTAPRRRIAIVGAGPGGLSAAIALHQAGHEVRVFERNPEVRPLGGGVLLSLPVLSILRSYGMDIQDLGAFTVTEFRNQKGRLRVRLPFNPRAEERAGIRGWHYGMLRAAAIKRMLPLLPPDLLHANHAFKRFEERADGVTLHFDNDKTWEADLLIGADGIRSAVAQQVFGELGVFHCGIQAWLAWCECDGLPRDVGAISHSSKIQASYFPMMHEGRPAYEWWIVEPWNEGQAFDGDIKRHVMARLQGFTGPVQKLASVTDFSKNIFRWEIYNRPPLSQWSHGRVSFVGDAVHPVSPYAAYGMGMAIEDGFYLAKSLRGVDLANASALTQGLQRYDAQRVNYTNTHAIMARRLGNMFHRVPWPLSTVRDLVYDHTPFLERMMVKDYLKDAEDQMLALEF